MAEDNENIQGWLEKRDAERLASRIPVSFHLIPESEAEKIMEQEDYSAAHAAAKPAAEGEEGEPPKNAVAENISISGLKLSGDMRLVGGKALKEGDYLLAEIQIPEAPMPVRALAKVVWADVDLHGDSSFHAGLFFVGINKHDVSKVARFLVLQRRAKQ